MKGRGENRTVLFLTSAPRQEVSARIIGVAEYARRLGLCVKVCDRVRSADRVSRELAEHRPAGCIAECGNGRVSFAPAMFGRVPTVFLDHCTVCGGCHVDFDSAGVARTIAQKFISLGYANFAYVHYWDPVRWSEERERSFRAAVGPVAASFSVFPGSRVRNRRALARFLRELPKPCAVMAANDGVGELVVDLAVSEGISIPSEIGVVGVDDYRLQCELLPVTLSSVGPDFVKGGSLAMKMLHQLMGGQLKGGVHWRYEALPMSVRASLPGLRIKSRVVDSALDVIRQQACLGLTPRDVAQCMGCSLRMAEIRFRRATGRSISQTILGTRLARVKELLMDPTYGVSAMPDMVGWTSPSALRKQFARAEGMSMTEFRRRALGRLGG